MIGKRLTLTMGYYPDAFAEEEPVSPPDIFVIGDAYSLDDIKQWIDLGGTEYELFAELLAEQVDLLASAVCGKYELDAVPWEDLFWAARTDFTKS